MPFDFLQKIGKILDCWVCQLELLSLPRHQTVAEVQKSGARASQGARCSHWSDLVAGCTESMSSGTFRSLWRREPHPWWGLHVTWHDWRDVQGEWLLWYHWRSGDGPRRKLHRESLEMWSQMLALKLAGVSRCSPMGPMTQRDVRDILRSLQIFSRILEVSKSWTPRKPGFRAVSVMARQCVPFFQLTLGGRWFCCCCCTVWHETLASNQNPA